MTDYTLDPCEVGELYYSHLMGIAWPIVSQPESNKPIILQGLV